MESCSTSLKLLEALPNLVSLSLKSYYIRTVLVVFPRVVLKSLKSITLDLSCSGMMTRILECLHVPLLERLVLGLEYTAFIKTDMDAICDSLVQLRHMTLRWVKLESSVSDLLLPVDHLKHLETLTIDNCFDDVDELFIALSYPSRGSSTMSLPQNG